MKKRLIIPWGLLFWMGALPLADFSHGQGAPDQPGTTRPTTAAIEPAAEDLLRKMGDKLKGAQQFTVTGKRTMDPALAQGRPVNLEITFELSVRRPNQLVARMEGNGTKRTFTYDGAQAALLDQTASVYATIDSAGTIDTMLDDLQEQYGFTPPLADFLVQDPYADLSRDIQSGQVRGRETVGGEECEHLSFSQENADWELWLATSDGMPRKFVLTQKDVPGRPRLEATFTKWDLAPRLEAGDFAFKAPQGAEKIEMIPLARIDEATVGQSNPQEKDQ